MKNLYIVLSRSESPLSHLVRLFSRDNLTHASLAFDRRLFHTYSFGRRKKGDLFFAGFKRERFDEWYYRNASYVPCVVKAVPATERQYNLAADLIGEMLGSADRYGYNYLGLAGNLLHMRLGKDQRFFCSEFVYSVLQRCELCDLGLPKELVRPQMLLKAPGEIIFSGNLHDYLYQPQSDGSPADELPNDFPRFRSFASRY